MARIASIRPESPADYDAIRHVNVEAFRIHPYSQQTEHLIVEALRAAGALEISLVAEVDGEVVGHIAFSAARIGDTTEGWFLLGPVAVLSGSQGSGIGNALVEAGLEQLRSRGAAGCVLVGDPAFYQRFGFHPPRRCDARRRPGRERALPPATGGRPCRRGVAPSGVPHRGVSIEAQGARAVLRPVA